MYELFLSLLRKGHVKLLIQRTLCVYGLPIAKFRDLRASDTRLNRINTGDFEFWQFAKAENPCFSALFELK
jgi:hypothetical protein